jgi:transposase
MIDQFKHILGIDISKKTRLGHITTYEWQAQNRNFVNAKYGGTLLIQWLETISVVELVAYLEATNIYGHGLAGHLYDEEFSVSIVNPTRIKGFAQSELLRTKTDKQDALLQRVNPVRADPRY